MGLHSRRRAQSLCPGSQSTDGQLRCQGPGTCLCLCHPQTHPQKGGESLAVVPDSEVVWLGPEDFHDVFIELGLLDLKEENSQLGTTQMCVKGTFSSEGPQ